MEFFIKKNATLPFLLIKLIKDGRSDFRKLLNMDNYLITFSMKNGNDIRILNKPCTIKEFDGEEYIVYQFTKKETKKIGTYVGEFNFNINDKIFSLPLETKLVINIVDSFVLNNNIDNNPQNQFNIISICCS
jgi:hypothetical protein